MTRSAGLDPTLPEHRAWLDDLARIAASNIVRHDTQWPIFHGSWDWHSAVHSHWTLVRYALVTGDRRHDAALRASLAREDGVEREITLLASEPGFEMPYGRAWLLLLVIDFERLFPDDRLLRPLGDHAMESMLAVYRKYSPTPRSFEYANSSFALLTMLQYARHRGDADAEAEIRAWVKECFTPEAIAELSFALDSSARAGFFSRLGNALALEAAVMTREELISLIDRLEIDDQELMPISGLKNDHHLGINPSRAHAFAVLLRVTGQERFGVALERHLVAAMKTHEARAGDYMAYDHWVASFCMRAFTEGLPLATRDTPGAPGATDE